MLEYVLLGIAFNIGVFVFVMVARGRPRKRMTFKEYKDKYGSVADSHPESYSNYNDYM